MNALYDKGRQAILEGSIAWLADAIKGVLVNVAGAHYAVNLVTDQFLSDIPVGARIATSGSLTSKTWVAGVADAAPITFPAVSGAVGGLVLYKDTGVAKSSPLIALFDTGLGLPMTLNGADLTITWADAPNRIFRLPMPKSTQVVSPTGIASPENLGALRRQPKTRRMTKEEVEAYARADLADLEAEAGRRGNGQ